MQRQRTKFLLKTAVPVFLLCSAPAYAARLPRIELLRSAAVVGTHVLLSDLLPANAPESLRKIATQISLGAAPQSGNRRILDRDAVERVASASEEVSSEVSVPERMVVSRDERPITLIEVFTAIRTALKQSGVASAGTLRPEDVLLESQVFVSPGDAGLQVMRMNLDRGLQRARFLLWPSHDPKILPFYVTARFATGLPLTPIRFGPEISQNRKNPSISVSTGQVKEPPVKHEILVAQGEQATLALQSAGVRIFVDVVTLEKGSLGQHIRVRLSDSGKVFDAQVDGRSHLEAKF